jgi:hypothetical protein
MLLEEQAAELLKRCENLVGFELRQVRGNLRNAGTRAAAVWELLVMDASSALGSIEYEPNPGGSPDIRLRIGEEGPIWLEATYLYPRFWDEERRSNAVAGWVFGEAERRGIDRRRISIRFDGIPARGAGPVRFLPKLNEEPEFLKNTELVRFFDAILSFPEESRTCSLPPFTVLISYSATQSHGSFAGLVQEAPTSTSEHAVYRKLAKKAKQHKVSGPRVICLGSDQSPALSPLNGPGTGRPSHRQAAWAALSKYPRVSAAIIVSIRSRPSGFGRLDRCANGDLFINPVAREPLTHHQIQSLERLDFNRWAYSYPLPKWESANIKFQRRMSGNLKCRDGAMSIKVEIPTDVVVDALAGKRSLAQAFDIDENEQPALAFKEGWAIVSSGLSPGHAEAGEAPKLVLELVPPGLAVFWPKK